MSSMFQMPACSRKITNIHGTEFPSVHHKHPLHLIDQPLIAHRQETGNS
uniref:Uncharacterized protein n=1 Tax=Arundo donax TaxID=35708 RepID=A0A0A9CN88_ARUDO